MKFRAFFPAFLLIILLSAGAFSEVVDEQTKLKEIQEKLEASRRKLLETKKKEGQALSQLAVTKKKLTQTEQDLNRLNRRISVNQEQIFKLASDLKVTHENLNSKAAAFRSRIKEVYKNSSVNYLELLFSSSNMSDFINRAYFFGKIVALDASLISGIARDYDKIQVDKKDLTRNTNEIKELAGEVEENKKVISAKAEEVKELYNELKGRREQYEKQVAELEKSSQELEREIVKKIAERRRQNVTISGNTGALDWPLRGRLTSYYGYRRHPYWGGRSMHTGLDIAAPYGEAIRAADGGEVIFSGWWDGYGKAIVIDHGKDISTVYAHMSRLYLQAGNQVKKGQIIGLVGSTGYSTGPHLHFEVRIKGKPKNPLSFLP